MTETINASLDAYRPNNYSKTLTQLDVHKYRDVCPQCGHRGRQVGSAKYDSVAVGVEGAGYVEHYECPRKACGAEEFTA